MVLWGNLKMITFKSEVPCKQCGGVIRYIARLRCVNCALAISRRSKAKRKERDKELNKRWRENNKEHVAKTHKIWRENNKGYIKKFNRSYREANLPILKARCMKRHCTKLQRIPKWVDLEKIERVYIDCPKGMEVDHIIPLQGDVVSGLHLAENLQYLTPIENRRKHNKFNPVYTKG
jgi:hypothetical protein